MDSTSWTGRPSVLYEHMLRFRGAGQRDLGMDAIASSVIGGTLLTGGVGNVIGSLFGVLIKGNHRVLYYLPGERFPPGG